MMDDMEHLHTGHFRSAFHISCAQDGHAMLWPQSANMVVDGLLLHWAQVAETWNSMPASRRYRRALSAVVSDARTYRGIVEQLVRVLGACGRMARMQQRTKVISAVPKPMMSTHAPTRSSVSSGGGVGIVFVVGGAEI
jgi:hypothetical protein